MARIYDQLAAVFRGEAPVDSVPATLLEFNVYKKAENILRAQRHHREMMIDEFPQPISDLIRKKVLEIHAAGRAKRLARPVQPIVEKVRVHRPEWSDWA